MIKNVLENSKQANSHAWKSSIVTAENRRFQIHYHDSIQLNILLELFMVTWFVHEPLACSLEWMKQYKYSEGTQYSATWELGTHKGLSKTVLNSEMVLFFRSISM